MQVCKRCTLNWFTNLQFIILLLIVACACVKGIFVKSSGSNSLQCGLTSNQQRDDTSGMYY